MNLLINILIVFAALVLSLFMIPFTVKIFGSPQIVAVRTIVFLLAAIDLLIRIVDLRQTKADLNARLVRPGAGGSLYLAPVWFWRLSSRFCLFSIC